MKLKSFVASVFPFFCLFLCIDLGMTMLGAKCARAASTWNVGFRIQGARGKLLLAKHVQTDAATVGDLTVKMLTESRIPFEGDATSIEMIAGLKADVVQMPSKQVRYLGWCYSVNGQTSADKMPNDFRLDASVREVVWFFAYALQGAGGQWSMCIPAD